MSHPVKNMLDAHPSPVDVIGDALAGCIELCFACAATCTSCADACISEKMVAELRKCIRLNLDCADICTATGRLLTRQTEYDRRTAIAQLKACREVCRVCAEECQRHADMHEHCRTCAETCRSCDQACADLLAAMEQRSAG